MYSCVLFTLHTFYLFTLSPFTSWHCQFFSPYISLYMRKERARARRTCYAKGKQCEWKSIFAICIIILLLPGTAETIRAEKTRKKNHIQNVKRTRLSGTCFICMCSFFFCFCFHLFMFDSHRTMKCHLLIEVYLSSWLLGLGFKFNISLLL